MTQLIQFLLKILAKLDKEEINKHKRIIEYIDALTENFNVIINYDKHTKNELDFAHKKLKISYNDIMPTIGNILDAQTIERIKLSLMSGRVLYHVICYSKVTDEDTIQDYEDRFNIYTKHQYYSSDEFRQNSYEKFIKYIVKDGEIVEEKEKKTKLSNLREVCMEDIARINSIKEELKTKLIYIVPL